MGSTNHNSKIFFKNYLYAEQELTFVFLLLFPKQSSIAITPQILILLSYSYSALLSYLT